MACLPLSAGMFQGLAAQSLTARNDLDVDINIGWQFDRFTAAELQNALNPEDSGDNYQSGLLDIRVNYRLYKSDDGEDSELWLYGNTARTIRGTTVICDDNPRFIGCSEFDGDFGDPGIPNADVAYSILRDAESLEAHAGLRYEFLKVPSDSAPSKLFVSYQKGFASVEGTDDLAEIDQVAVGLVVTEGIFKNSFLERGWGRNELFVEDSDDRNKFTVHLEYEWHERLIGFLETEVDYDDSTGSDSVRTKIGIEIPLAKISN